MIQLIRIASLIAITLLQACQTTGKTGFVSKGKPPSDAPPEKFSGNAEQIYAQINATSASRFVFRWRAGEIVIGTQRGLRFTSEPSGATVIVDCYAHNLSQQGRVTASDRWTFVTPAYDPESGFTLTGTRGEFRRLLNYVITVSKPGYQTIVQRTDPAHLTNTYHWVLKPAATGANSQ
jgi:hypothetical protein